MSKINPKSVSLHEMFEAKMNKSAIDCCTWKRKDHDKENNDIDYFKQGYTAALNDLQGKIDGILTALNEIKEANMPVASLQFIAEEAIAEFYAPVANKNGEKK